MQIKKYLNVQIVINIIVNAIVSFFLGSSKLEGLAVIPLIAPDESPFDPSMAGELIVGSFIVGVILTLLLTSITRVSMRKGHMEEPHFSATGWVGKLPTSLLLRTLCLGFISALAVALPIVVVLGILNISEVSTTSYLFVHTLYAGLLGGALAYVVVKRALME